jgi:hypothetical protein
MLDLLSAKMKKLEEFFLKIAELEKAAGKYNSSSSFQVETTQSIPWLLLSGAELRSENRIVRSWNKTKERSDLEKQANAYWAVMTRSTLCTFSTMDVQISIPTDIAETGILFITWKDQEPGHNFGFGYIPYWRRRGKGISTTVWDAGKGISTTIWDAGILPKPFNWYGISRHANSVENGLADLVVEVDQCSLLIEPLIVVADENGKILLWSSGKPARSTICLALKKRRSQDDLWSPENIARLRVFTN